MAKQELSIESSYLPSWGVWEGVREIVQNGKDAETEHSAKLTVKHDKGTLIIVNEGTTIPLEALLLGRTSKSGKANLIGQFGEGLDLGLLALVRAGRGVKIRTGDQVWKPVIAPSKSFDAEVLWIEHTGGRKFQNRAQFEIEVTAEEWEDFRSNFMFLGEIPDEDIVVTSRGKLLLGDKLRGKIYVKGIFVQYDPKSNYGYDYSHANVDRDRKMISAWDKNWENSLIWQSAVNKNPKVMFEPFFKLLQEEKSDLSGMHDHAISSLNDDTLSLVAARFESLYGANAVPVENLEQCVQLEHLGRKGVVTPNSLRQVIQRKQGSLSAVADKLRKEILKTYSWFELTTEEKYNITLGTKLIESIEEFPKAKGLLSLVSVVDFRSDTLLGQFKDGNIFLSKKILVDREETIATMVHEFAHFEGMDGAYGHVSLMEKIWKGVIKAIIDGKVTIDAAKEEKVEP
jgi:hypothetical protein